VPLPTTKPVNVIAPVPPFATGSVSVTCVVKLMGDKVPPNVRLPEVVTVPVKVSPLTVPVPVTLLTEPLPLPLLLNVVQSAEVNAPLLVADASGTFRVMTGVVVLFATVLERSVPDTPSVNAATLVTVPLLVGVPLTQVVPLDVKTCR